MSWIWWILLAADTLLVVVLLAILLKVKREPDRLPEVVQPPDLDGFIQESTRLTEEFDRLLTQKRELISSTLEALDSRISELKKMQKEVAVATEPKPARKPSTVERDDVASFRSKVRELAKKGQNPADIAKATGRPRGEVELVLGLSGGEG